MKKNYSGFSILTLLLFASLASAQSMQTRSTSVSVMPSSSSNISVSVPSAGNIVRTCSGSACPLKVIIKSSCFATNLRAVSNPISPDTIITADLSFSNGPDTYRMTVDFPGAVAAAAGMLPKNGISFYDNLAGGVYQKNYSFEKNGVPIPKDKGRAITSGNVIVVYTPFEVAQSPSVAPVGAVRLLNDISKTSFSQVVPDCSKGADTPVYGCCGYSKFTPAYTCGAFMAQSGPVSANVGSLILSKDKSTLEVSVSFPGQVGFCGGYFSPLMIFPDEARPQFTSQTDFPLNPGSKSYWTENNHPGYFLVLDRKGDGKITKKDQLFGNGEDAENGFEQLRKLDSNNDGFIDSKDVDFKHLYLWKDENSNGIADQGELIPAKKLIHRISLNYEKGNLRPLGRHAEERETSAVQIYDKNRKIKQAIISDIWLSPATPN